MTRSSSRYADWKAPADDGQMLIWPGAGALLADAQNNFHRLRKADVVVAGVPLNELRRRQRQWIGHDNARLLIATGHQTELYHPGVWVKNALIHAAAARADGAAYHFAVDTDSPKHLHLRWPGASRPITEDARMTTAAWSGLLKAPSPQHLAGVRDDLREAAKAWNFTPAIEPFFASMRRLALEQPSLSAALTNSLHQVDWDLGLRYHALITSPMWRSEPYLVLVHHLMAGAGDFARDYNAALAEYRSAHGIRTPVRPMPDLHVEAEQCESPFWVDRLGAGHRDRAVLRPRNGGWALVLDGDEFVFESAAEGWSSAQRLDRWLAAHDARICPRALTLTLFFRLLLADQFVHGIGGGRYDQVTDRVIQTHFGLEPPQFCVTTATLYFPTAASKRPVNLHPLVQEGRRIRHGMFSKTKPDALARIDAAPRNSPRRLAAFVEMHRQLAAETNDAAHRDWENRLRQAEHDNASQRQLLDREFFFAIQSAERLKMLIDRYEFEM